MSERTATIDFNANPHQDKRQKNEEQEPSNFRQEGLSSNALITEGALKLEGERNVKLEYDNSSNNISSGKDESSEYYEDDEEGEYEEGEEGDYDEMEIEFEEVPTDQQGYENPSTGNHSQSSEFTEEEEGNGSLAQPSGDSSEAETKLLIDSNGLIQKTSHKDIDSDIHNLRFRRRKKNRKIRTTITREKLVMMNEIFSEYTKQKEEGKNPRHNLKEIGNQLSLGYSTILHKYREYRSAKVVKGGALIASLQKKRKYKKSLHIQRTIEQALQKQSFYTAVELSEYIFRETKKKFSRSIISRHLGEMGYSYKNLKISPIQKNKPKYKQNRRIYASIILPFISKNYLLVYIDEFALSISTFMKKKNIVSSFDKYENTEGDYVSVIAAASVEGVLHFSIKHGFYTRREFCECVFRCFANVRDMKYHNRYYDMSEKKAYLITDMNKIHLDPEGEHEDKPIARVLAEIRANRLFLPPASPQLNPLDSIFTNLKHRLQKRDIRSHNDLLQLMQKNMIEISKEPTQIYFKDVVTSLEKSRMEQNL